MTAQADTPRSLAGHVVLTAGIVTAIHRITHCYKLSVNPGYFRSCTHSMIPSFLNHLHVIYASGLNKMQRLEMDRGRAAI